MIAVNDPLSFEMTHSIIWLRTTSGCENKLRTSAEVSFVKFARQNSASELP
jgi:hypothetical protein